jgi:hypothetical protein
MSEVLNLGSVNTKEDEKTTNLKRTIRNNVLKFKIKAQCVNCTPESMRLLSTGGYGTGG